MSCFPVLEYSVGISQGGGVPWDLGREKKEEREEYTKKETEIILAFIIMVMILLIFTG